MLVLTVRTHDETGKRRNMEMQSKELLKYTVELEKGEMKER